MGIAALNPSYEQTIMVDRDRGTVTVGP